MEINIESVMDEIRAEIKEKGYTPDMLSFKEAVNASSASLIDSDSFSNDLSEAVIYINDCYIIPESVPVSGNVFVRFIKKIIRKFLRFYVKPIVMSQNEFNALCVRAFNDINGYIDETSKVNITELEDKINVLELKIKTVTKENERLIERIEKLEKLQK